MASRRDRRALALIAACGAGPAVAAAVHPLDPLDADELAIIETVLKQSGRFSDGTNFAWVQLQEPAKDAGPGFRPRHGLCRVAPRSTPSTM